MIAFALRFVNAELASSAQLSPDYSVASATTDQWKAYGRIRKLSYVFLVAEKYRKRPDQPDRKTV